MTRSDELRDTIAAKKPKPLPAILIQALNQIFILPMRFILFLLIVFATGCSEQNNNSNQSKIDTVKLFNPNNHPNNSGAQEVSMFRRSIILTLPDFYAKLNDNEYKFENPEKLSDFIKTNKAEIQKDLFYVLIDSTTSFTKIVSTIDTLTTHGITDYKVINIQTYFSPPEPVYIQTPPSVEAIYDERDSSYFSITILDKGFTVSLSGRQTELKTLNDLDAFFAAHKAEIKKIIIITSRDTPDNKLEAAIEVLKKHKFNNFSLGTK